ncbi:hypothetical protein GJ496_002945 [Pomphorhynchus laevis]|nr:hypothetical protein GJ496_002945 [Pomphorhynchus laevis]
MRGNNINFEPRRKRTKSNASILDISSDACENISQTSNSVNIDTSSHSQIITWKNTFHNFDNATKIQAFDCLIRSCNYSQLNLFRDLADKLTRRDFLSLLPQAISLRILSYLNAQDVCSCLSVSRHWYNMAVNCMIWKKHALLMNGFVTNDDGHLNTYRKEYIAGLLIKKSWFLSNDNRSRKTRRSLFDASHPVPLTSTIRTHDDHAITCLLFENDYIVTASDDGQLKVWHPNKSLLTLIGHRGGVWCADMDGQYIASGSTDRTVRIWNVDTGNCLHILYGHSSTVRCIVVKNDVVVSGSRDGTLRRWSINQGCCIKLYIGHTAAIRCVCIANDFIISGAYDCTVRVWAIQDGRCIYLLAGHENRIYSLQVACDIVVSGSLDSTVRIWNLKTGQCEFVLQGHHAMISVLNLCYRRRLLVTGNADSTLRLWDMTDGKCIALLAGDNKHSSAITGICHNRNYIISSSDDGYVKLWDLHNGAFIRNIIRLDSAGNGGVIWNVCCTESKLICAAGSRNGTEDTKLIIINFEDIWLHYFKRQRTFNSSDVSISSMTKTLSCGCKP